MRVMCMCVRCMCVMCMCVRSNDFVYIYTNFLLDFGTVTTSWHFVLLISWIIYSDSFRFHYDKVYYT
jgi:purine-cytosine permease-like protein